MRKAAETKEATTPAPSSEKLSTDKQQKSYWELKIPRMNIKSTANNTYLVITLVIFSFFLGMLTNKVMYLEQAAKNPQANTAANAAAGDQAAIDTPIPPPQIVKVDNGTLPLKGDKNAKVTIVEFSDFQCPFCKQYFDATHGQIDEKYVKTGKVKFAYRHYPLTAIHPNAQIAGEASECANEQNKFWEFHDKLFDTQEEWSPKTSADVITAFAGYAGELGMDSGAMQSCLENHKFKKKVEDDTAAGSDIQVDGTPAFFINGYRLTGAQPFSEFEKVIEDELKK